MINPDSVPYLSLFFKFKAFIKEINFIWFAIKHIITRQVSSMIHSARPIVKPVANNVFCCFIFLDLKSGDGQTDEHYVRKQWAPPAMTLGWPSGSKERKWILIALDFSQSAIKRRKRVRPLKAVAAAFKGCFGRSLERPRHEDGPPQKPAQKEQRRNTTLTYRHI